MGKKYEISDARFIKAFREFMEYDDEWVETQEKLGGVVKEADVKNYDTGFDDDGFQHGEGV